MPHAANGISGSVSKAADQSARQVHTIYPYLFRGLSIERPNQVWARDICYIPMAKGFMYLTVIMDWASRRVLAWRILNTLETDAYVEALEEAVLRYGAPEIFNTDQGAQYTSEAFTAVLKGKGIHISMDGKGRWGNNVFVERLWRSVKYEEVYLGTYETLLHSEWASHTILGFILRNAATRC